MILKDLQAMLKHGCSYFEAMRSTVLTAKPASAVPSTPQTLALPLAAVAQYQIKSKSGDAMRRHGSSQYTAAEPPVRDKISRGREYTPSAYISRAGNRGQLELQLAKIKGVTPECAAAIANEFKDLESLQELHSPDGEKAQHAHERLLSVSYRPRKSKSLKHQEDGSMLPALMFVKAAKLEAIKVACKQKPAVF